VSDQVKPKEDAIFGGDPSALTKREALAVELAERIAGDPHTVTSEFWQTLKEEFSDDEIVELAFACSIFNWGNKFNITMQLDTDGTTYPSGMAYREVEK
jgi:alkylhydroperoxidase family enzyme